MDDEKPVDVVRLVVVASADHLVLQVDAEEVERRGEAVEHLRREHDAVRVRVRLLRLQVQVAARERVELPRGVVDDVAITQIAIVQELPHTNPDLDLGTLFQKAFRVGREHVGALVNTLAFAYIGASLPLFVLLSLAPEGILIALQKEPVIVEIIRIFSGSIGVLLVVPIATALAVFYKNSTTIKNTHTHSHT